MVWHASAPSCAGHADGQLSMTDQDTLVDWLLIEPSDGSGPLTQLLYVAATQRWPPELTARRCRRFLASLSGTR